MKYKLTFHKAFGIESIPYNYFPLFLILKNKEYQIQIKNNLVLLRLGKYGVGETEKRIIGAFYHSDERILSKMPEIPTLDISLDVELDLPQDCNPCDEQFDADNLVAPYTQVALSAVSKFIYSFNCMKHVSTRSKSEWKSQRAYLIPEISEADFKTYLFYKIEGNEQTCLGCINVGRTIIATEIEDQRDKLLREILIKGVPFTKQLLLKSWDLFFEEDYRSTIIYAATIAELAISEIIRNKYTARKITSNTQIDTFLDDTSKRLLCTVILGSLNVGDSDLRENLRELFVIRNGIVHGKSKTAKKIDAEKALESVESILKLMEDELRQQVSLG
jgi:hypothetical protein